MKPKLFALFFALMQLTAFAQQPPSSGTYQVQVVNSRLLPNIPGNIEALAREKRKKSERVYIQLDANIRIMILSEDEIKQKEFKPLPLVAHINSTSNN